MKKNITRPMKKNITRPWTPKELQIVQNKFGDPAWDEYQVDPKKFIQQVAIKLNRTIPELLAKMNEL